MSRFDSGLLLQRRWVRFLIWWAINAGVCFGSIHPLGWILGMPHGHGIYTAMYGVAVFVWLTWGTVGAIVQSGYE